jgi:hypothetical protein
MQRLALVFPGTLYFDYAMKLCRQDGKTVEKVKGNTDHIRLKGRLTVCRNETFI